MASDRGVSRIHHMWILGAAALVVGVLLPSLTAGSDAARLDPGISETATRAPATRVDAVISLRSVTRPSDVLTLLAEADEVLALYHGWQGMDSDYVGGYEFLGDGATLEIELATYRAAYESMLRETVANIEKSSPAASAADATGWATARQDAENRLAAFLAGDLPVVGACVWARAAVLAAWSQSAAAQVRLIEPAQSGRSVRLPWR